MNTLKSILITAYFILTGFFSVMSWVFTDVANTPFWWTFWDVTGALSILGFIGGVVYLYAKQPSKK